MMEKVHSESGNMEMWSTYNLGCLFFNAMLYEEDCEEKMNDGLPFDRKGVNYRVHNKTLSFINSIVRDANRKKAWFKEFNKGYCEAFINFNSDKGDANVAANCFYHDLEYIYNY